MKTMYSLMTMVTAVGIGAGVAGVACSAEKAGRMMPAASAEKGEGRGAEKNMVKAESQNAGDAKVAKASKKAKTEKASDKATVKPAKKEKDGKRQALDGKRAQVVTKTEGRRKKA